MDIIIINMSITINSIIHVVIAYVHVVNNSNIISSLGQEFGS